MVDGHEHEKQKDHRKYFTTKYLTAIEPRCHRSVQLTQGQFQSLSAHNKVLNTGHTYDGIDGSKIIEFCVDDHECL